MSGSAVVTPAETVLGGTIKVSAEAVIAACALLNTTGDVLEDFGFPFAVRDEIYKGSDRLRLAAFGYGAATEDDHPVLARMDELNVEKLAELRAQIGMPAGTIRALTAQVHSLRIEVEARLDKTDEAIQDLGDDLEAS
jgi:hypothetical protein